MSRTSEYNNEAGLLIARHMEDHQIGVVKAAETCGVAQSTLSQWLHGSRRPRDIRQVYRLLDYIKASPELRGQVFRAWGFPIAKGERGSPQLSLAEVAEELSDLERTLSTQLDRVRALQSAVANLLLQG